MLLLLLGVMLVEVMLMIRFRLTGPPILMQLVPYARLPAGVLLRRQVRDLHVDGLHLLVLWRDRAEPVADLVARQWHILSLDVGDVYENVVPAGVRGDETVSFASAERLHLTLLDRVPHGTIGCGSGPRAARYDRRGQLQMRRAGGNAGEWWPGRRLCGRNDTGCRFVVRRNLDAARHGASCSALRFTWQKDAAAL